MDGENQTVKKGGKGGKMAKIFFGIGIVLLIASVVGILRSPNRAEVFGSAKDFLFNFSQVSSTEDRAGAKAVAIVNGEEITINELNMRLEQGRANYEAAGANLEDEAVRQSIEGEIVAQLVREELVLQRAGEEGIIASDERIQEEYGTIIENAGGEEALDARLLEFGMTRDELMKSIAEQIVIGDFINAHVKVDESEITEEEIMASYDESVAGTENGPALEEVRDQVRDMIVQQKFQQKVLELLAQLEEEGEVEILL